MNFAKLSLFIFIILIITFFSTHAQESWNSIQSFTTSGVNPVCIGWAEKFLWVVDSSARKIFKINPADGSIISSIESKAEDAKAIAWDSTNFWVLDNKTKMILSVNPATGDVINRIKAPSPDGEGYWSLEGLAWDGQNLWVAYYAGFSSSICKVDPVNGKVIESFFSDSHPKGLATDGKKLWTINYNGEKFPATIDVRDITKSGFDIVKSRKFIATIPIDKVKSIAFDGKNVWIIDLMKKNINKFKMK